MRILAVRGENLASLAGSFAIDFTTGPLSHGLFAISGPTGAGKSTVLDAMCLALYHTTPRLSEPNDGTAQVPDGVTDLPARDPRHLIRRGTAEGFAEVDFLDASGVAWRARWQAHRARKRPDGQFQNATAILRTMDGSATVAGTITEVRERITATVGLTFSQFRRSVLLAQNDFAALLKAKHDERALLLEALTHGEAFSAISRCAFERHREEKFHLDHLLDEHAHLQWLDDEQRAELLATVDAARIHVDTLRAQEAHLASLQEWLEQGERYSAAVREATGHHAQLAQALLDDAPRKASLDRAACLRPAQSTWETFVHAREAVENAAAAAVTHAHRDDEHARVVQNAQTAVERAAIALEQVRTIRAREQPRIIAARAADLNLALGRTTHAAQVASAHALRTELDENAVRIAAVERDMAPHAASEAAWAQFVAMHPGLVHDADAASFPALGRALEENEAAWKEHAHTAAEHDRLHTAERVQQDALCGAEAALLTAHAARDAATATWTAHEAALASIDVVSLEEEARRLQVRASASAEARRLHAAWIEAMTRQTQAVDAVVGCTNAIDVSAHRRADASVMLQDSANELSAARDALERTTLAAHEVTAALRATLLPGEPCLVCGATEHPAAQQSSHAIDGVLASLTASVERAQAAHTQAVHDDATAHSAHDAAVRAWQDAQRAADAAARDVSARQAELSSICAQLGIAADGEVSERLHAVATELQRDHVAVETRRTAIQAARDAVSTSHQTLRHAQAAVDLAHAARDAAREQLQPLVFALARIVEKRAEDAARRDALHERIRDCVGDKSIATDGVCADGSLWALWRAAAPLYEAARQGREPLVALRARNTELAAQRSSLLEDIAAADRAVAAAQQLVDDAVAARSAALDARDVEAYATDLEDRELAARASLDVCQRNLDEARLAATAAHVDRERAEAVLEQRRDQLAEALTALRHALAVARAGAPANGVGAERTPLQIVLAEDLLALDAWANVDITQGVVEKGVVENGVIEDGVAEHGDDAISDSTNGASAQIQNAAQALATLRAAFSSIPVDLDESMRAWQARERAVLDQHARVEALAAQVDVWRAQARTTHSRNEVDLARDNVRAALHAAHETCSAAEGRLAVDDDARRRGAERAAAIAQQRRVLRRWEILNELIGSSDGKKFRVLAQQISLEVLLDMANQHLDALAPRYRLVTGREPLSLLVVDQDFAGEQRSVHSLSGGETFLVSLALALGLSSLSAARVRVESLFIDEGFGSLDADTLHVAMGVLDRLQAEGRRVGVISHVHEMAERIGTQIRVVRHPAGHSTVEVLGG